jgi:MinD-like ATPase involved in chromosome partitioning or flagellar assembly
MSVIIEAPMTWMDVARRLACLSLSDDSIPPNLVRARVAWYGITFETTASVQTPLLVSWLESLFPARIRENPLRLELEGPIKGAELLIELEIVEAESNFHQSFGIIDGVVEFKKSFAVNVPRPVPVVAALSVKGGTGRTTTATAFALRWASSSNKPVLLVDGDLEAPGISYLFQNFAGTPKISLEDVITLAHAEETSEGSETIVFASERLRDHLIPGNLIVLPLRRDIEELASSALRPEHLSTPQRPFALADILSQIAARLGCSGVVIDVRAGLVPLGVTLAMDPQVSPIIVTTLADQSIRATAGLVRFLAREIRRAGGNLRRPLLVINRVPAVFKQTGMDKILIEPLISDLLASLVSDQSLDIGSTQGIFDNLTDLDPFAQVEVPELPDIQVPSGEWIGFVEQISGSGFNRIVGSGMDQWIAAELESNYSQNIIEVEVVATPAKKSGRDQLADYARQLIAAENAQGQVPKPLVTQPLAAMAQRFQSEVPIAVSEGAKGTGKTLAARYLISQGLWSSAVQSLIGVQGAVSAVILPVCASIQSSSVFQVEVDVAREAAARTFGFQSPMKVYETTAWLKEQIPLAHSEKEWVSLWIDVIAWSVGFNPRIKGAGEELFEALRQKDGRSIVAVIEGLEELYLSVADPGVDSAMRAALVALPQRLRSESRRPVGALIFVRRDTVEAAIRQNLDQYRREHASFALSWTEDDVLELAAWLATQSGALPNLWDNKFSSKPLQEKTRLLESLWGKKLGPDDIPGKRTREAYTATWIVAVLSDLRGRLVPRDLVRLLASAATAIPEGEEIAAYGTRLLVPRALKNAIEPTSEAKVSEAEEEISELKPIFAKFRLKRDEVVAPLSKDSLDEIGITSAEVDVLIRQGIVFGETSPYEVSELYRRGLGLRHIGARRSVVNLYRRARQR